MTKREKQDTARMILVEMAKLSGTPISVLADFIVAHDISGLSIAQTHGLTQASSARLNEAFRAAWPRMVAKRQKDDNEKLEKSPTYQEAVNAISENLARNAPASYQAAMAALRQRRRNKA